LHRTETPSKDIENYDPYMEEEDPGIGLGYLLFPYPATPELLKHGR
jgi:hypothetical protein